jgi:Spy/CpxP family protein refolding chaperone
MLKQSSSRMKKVLAILLAVLFVVSLTAVAVSAANEKKDPSSVHPIGGGWDGLEGSTPCHWVFNGFSWQYTCSPYSGWPYI